MENTNMQDPKTTENLAMVKKAMEDAEKIRLGGELKTGVALDYTSFFGQHFTGTVVFKRPTMQDYMRMGALKSEYFRMAGVKDIDLVDQSIKQMAQCMSVLKVVIVKAPEWLVNLEAIQEADVLYYVYDKYSEWEDSFRKPSTPAPEGNSTNS